jgi:P-type conjugative transfer ATPase TrbB
MDTAESRRNESLRQDLGPVYSDPEATHQLAWNICAALENDPYIIEIMVNPDRSVWIDRAGAGMSFIGYKPPWETESALGTVAASLDRIVTRDNPVVEGELGIANGRIEGFLPPLTAGPSLCIRVPAKRIYRLVDYVSAEIITFKQLSSLTDAVAGRKNIVIAGGTGSGKTTLANALIAEIDAGERQVIIEDTSELQCRAPNAVHLHTADNFDLRRLIRATLRVRPDRIIIGEVRGGEALELLKAWSTGHPGGVTTVHANNAKEALWKLNLFAMEASAIGQERLIASTVNMVVFIEKTDGGRKVTNIQNVRRFNGTDFELD